MFATGLHNSLGEFCCIDIQPCLNKTAAECCRIIMTSLERIVSLAASMGNDPNVFRQQMASKIVGYVNDASNVQKLVIEMLSAKLEQIDLEHGDKILRVKLQCSMHLCMHLEKKAVKCLSSETRQFLQLLTRLFGVSHTQGARCQSLADDFACFQKSWPSDSVVLSAGKVMSFVYEHGVRFSIHSRNAVRAVCLWSTLSSFCSTVAFPETHGLRLGLII